MVEIPKEVSAHSTIKSPKLQPVKKQEFTKIAEEEEGKDQSEPRTSQPTLPMSEKEVRFYKEDEEEDEETKIQKQIEKLKVMTDDALFDKVNEYMGTD